MRQRIIGLGLFALITFLSFFIPGPGKVIVPPSEGVLYEASATTDGITVQPDVIALPQQGILQARCEISDSFQLVRKFPLAASFLFLLTQPAPELVQNQLPVAFLEFSPPKDLLISNRVLRI